MSMGIMEGVFGGEAEKDLQEEFYITEVFKASFHGDCALDAWHKIRRNDLIGRAVRGDNPLVVIRGYVCAACVKSYPRLDG